MNRIRNCFAWLLSQPRKLLAWLPVIVSPRWVNDTFFAIGLVLLAVGCGLIYPPLAFIVTGVSLIGLAISGIVLRALRKKGGTDG